MKSDIIFFIYVLIFGFPQNSNGSLISEKREVDLEVYSDRKEAAESAPEENDGIIDVCSEGGNIYYDAVKCNCILEERTMVCYDGLQNASIRPVAEKFVFEKAYLWFAKNLSLQKEKIFPENRETIKLLSVHHVEFGQIDAGVFDDLSSLETLTFASSTFPEAMKIDETFLTENLGKRLLKLKINDASLYSLNASIFKNLINLEELALDENGQRNGKIVAIFPVNLKSLWLQGCNLTLLDETIFGNLTKLEELILNRNLQEKGKIAGNFLAGLSNLKTLQMSFCNLTFLHQNAFDNLRKLESLDLKGNKFASIPTALNVLSNLQNLSLFHSQNLISIQDCAFCPNINLKTIDLAHSWKLTYFHENAFGSISRGSVPQIEKFIVESCNISVLPEKLLQWENVKHLGITENRFACNCSMAWLFKDLLSNNSIYEKKLSSHYYEIFLHQKFNLGCTGYAQYGEKHTSPKSIHEVFDSCHLSPPFSFTFWLCVLFLIFAAILFFTGIYSNRTQIEQFLK